MLVMKQGYFFIRHLTKYCLEVILLSLLVGFSSLHQTCSDWMWKRQYPCKFGRQPRLSSICKMNAVPKLSAELAKLFKQVSGILYSFYFAFKLNRILIEVKIFDIRIFRRLLLKLSPPDEQSWRCCLVMYEIGSDGRWSFWCKIHLIASANVCNKGSFLENLWYQQVLVSIVLVEFSYDF